MEQSPIRILHVVTELGMGGIQSFIMNVYRNINRNKYQFDFLLSVEQKGVFEDEIEKLGGRIFRVTSRNKSMFKNKSDLEYFFNNNKYSCVHCHFSNLSYLIPLKIATIHNVPKRIIHSHSTHLPINPLHRLLHKYNKYQLDSLATDFFACSDLAGKWLFEGTKGYYKQIIVKNGINVNNFIFDDNSRNTLRENLGISDRIVLGCVGRLSVPKNHIFLLDIIAQLQKMNPKFLLLLVGEGPERKKIEQKIKILNIDNNVQLLGTRHDISQLLQAFDCFVMPSKWEGFPVALLEAEAAGLPAYVSDSITKQAKINENIKYVPLNYGSYKWANLIYTDCSSWRRIKDSKKIIASGYDIKTTVDFLEKEYSLSNR